MSVILEVIALGAFIGAVVGATVSFAVGAALCWTSGKKQRGGDDGHGV